MQWIDLLGYVVSLLLFLVFYMEDTVPLCIAFLAYAGILHLARISIVHSALAPIDERRLQINQIGAARGSDRRQVSAVN